MIADYSFELISIETYAPQFIEHNKFFLGSVGKGTRGPFSSVECSATGLVVF